MYTHLTWLPFLSLIETGAARTIHFCLRHGGEAGKRGLCILIRRLRCEIRSGVLSRWHTGTNMALFSLCSPTVAQGYRRCMLPLPVTARCQRMEISSRSYCDELRERTMQEAVCCTAGRQGGFDTGDAKPLGGDLESNKLRVVSKRFVLESDKISILKDAIRKVLFLFVVVSFKGKEIEEERLPEEYNIVWE